MCNSIKFIGVHCLGFEPCSDFLIRLEIDQSDVLCLSLGWFNPPKMCVFLPVLLCFERLSVLPLFMALKKIKAKLPKLTKLTFSKLKISKWAVFENLVSANNSITFLKKIFVLCRDTSQPAQRIYLNAACWTN